MNTAISPNQEKERAREMLERFVRRFHESYRLLAYHAALPLVLTPELVNFLRVQFLRGDNVPWVAEVDLLLSDLCRQVGYELYAMDTAVRSYLLERMKEELGEQRMQEVAKSLISYVRYLAQTHPYISPQELQTQQWAAMVYIDRQREKAVSEITQAFQNAASPTTSIGQGLVNRAEMARLARITQELAPQLSAYENLVAYARLVTQVLTNPSQVEQEALNRSYPVLSGLELSLPPELVPPREQPESGLPPLQVFEFETATLQIEEKTEEKREFPFFRRKTVTKTEIKINRRRTQARFFTEDLGNGITLEMVAIPGGTFTMGAPETEEGSNRSERPQHQVTVPSFFMSKYPVTQAQWGAVAALPRVRRDLKRNPSTFKGDNRPVETVSWFDATEFCERLSNYAKREYRLSSEAEWEYACRAGTTTPFYFGETMTTELANYNGKEYTYGNAPKGEYRERTTPVGSFPPNAFGLCDMHGNVWEWCADAWHENYKGAPIDGSVWVEASDSDNDNNNRRFLRGGSWFNNPDFCRSAYRDSYFPDLVSYDFGFRVVWGVARTI